MREEDTFTEYLLDQGLAPSSVRVYERLARRIERSRQTPVEWLRTHVKPQTPAGTVCSYTAAVRHLLEFHDEPVPEPLIPKRVRRQNPSQAQYREALSEEELDAYLDVIERSGITEPSYTILQLLPYTGMRIGETCRLPRTSLEKLRGRRVLRVVGKGDRERLVPLSARAWHVLETYLKHTRPKDSKWMFPSVRGGGHVSPNGVRDQLRQVRDEMPGEARSVTPHVLRHTAATRLLAAGVDLPSVQAILGHASMSTTGRYLHPSVDTLGEALDKL